VDSVNLSYNLSLGWPMNFMLSLVIVYCNERKHFRTSSIAPPTTPYSPTLFATTRRPMIDVPDFMPLGRLSRCMFCSPRFTEDLHGTQQQLYINSRGEVTPCLDSLVIQVFVRPFRFYVVQWSDWVFHPVWCLNGLGFYVHLNMMIMIRMISVY
jgi:hypothetical protein